MWRGGRDRTSVARCTLSIPTVRVFTILQYIKGGSFKVFNKEIPSSVPLPSRARHVLQKSQFII